MKVISAQGAVPTNEDGLIVYSGKYINSGTTPYEIVIQTDLKQVFFCKFEADNNLGYASIPTFEQQVIQLGYIEGTTAGNVNFTTSIPGSHTVRYIIVGTQRMGTIQHPEQGTPSGKTIATARFTKVLEAFIVGAGTSATEFVNSTGDSFTYSKVGTGQYRITAANSSFSLTKTHVTFTLENAASYAPGIALHWFAMIVATDKVDILIYDGVAGALIDPPGGIFITIKTYPS